jgi:transcriptional regulator with XRE-family HTH domain
MATQIKSPAGGFAAKLRYLLELRGMSQIRLSELSGLSQSRISKWLKPTGEPKPRQLATIARALNCSLDFLCDPEVTDPALERDSTLQPEVFTAWSRSLQEMASGLSDVANAVTHPPGSRRESAPAA